MISTLSYLFRLGGVGLVCAREGLFELVDPASLSPQLRLVWRLGRVIERPSAVDAKHQGKHVGVASTPDVLDIELVGF